MLMDFFEELDRALEVRILTVGENEYARFIEEGMIGIIQDETSKKDVNFSRNSSDLSWRVSFRWSSLFIKTYYH